MGVAYSSNSAFFGTRLAVRSCMDIALAIVCATFFAYAIFVAPPPPKE